MSRAPRVFISHSSTQADVASYLKGVLEERGIFAWIATEEVDPGASFDEAIIEEIKRTDAIVLLFSAEADKSRHVKREIMLAEKYTKPLIPLRIENVLPQDLEYWLQSYQWIEWFKQRDIAKERLIEAIFKTAGVTEGTAQTKAASARSPALSETPTPTPPADPPSEPEAPLEKKLLQIAGAGFGVVIMILVIAAASRGGEDTNPTGVYDFNDQETADALPAEAADGTFGFPQEISDAIARSDYAPSATEIGVDVIPIDLQAANRLGLDYSLGGLIVTRVVSGSMAARDDVREGDVIRTFNGQNMSASWQIDDVLRQVRFQRRDGVSLLFCRPVDEVCWDMSVYMALE